MQVAPSFAQLPDPTDRSTAWVDREPAYYQWWNTFSGDIAQLPGEMPFDELVREYSDVVPNRPALDSLTRLGPLVEVGAGTGYWSRLLQDLGVDVLPTDIEPRTKQWTKVHRGDHIAASIIRDRGLFVCYPFRNNMMPELLRRSQQLTLALVTDGRANSRDAMYDILESEWIQVEAVSLPTWGPVRREHLMIWNREGT